jgi:hypothetical protein
MDAGRDAGGADEDGGTDAGSVADAGSDAGADPDSGPLMVGDCAAAPITLAADCPDFTACGGEIAEGDYCYTGVCIEEASILDPARDGASCPTARLENASGMIAGQVSFLAGDQVRRETVSHAEVTLVFPSTCVLAVLGCSVAGGQIEDSIPGSSATCSVVGGDCRCDITIDSAVDTTDSYTADETAGVLTVGTGGGQREYGYCADDTDGTIDFVETTEDALEPGIQSIAPAPAP